MLGGGWCNDRESGNGDGLLVDEQSHRKPSRSAEFHLGRERHERRGLRKLSAGARFDLAGRASAQACIHMMGNGSRARPFAVVRP